MDTVKHINSTSWSNGEYDLFFYGLVRGLRPKLVVELGTYAGYSAYCMASALKDNGFGRLDCYDLWENYPFNHVFIKEAKENLKGLPVNLNQEDAFLAHFHYKPFSIDLLMVDISNNGDTFKRILQTWEKVVSPNGIIMFEGGTEERDQVEWMKKYEKPSIVETLREDKYINDKYNWSVIDCFPGLTIFTKKDPENLEVLSD